MNVIPLGVNWAGLLPSQQVFYRGEQLAGAGRFADIAVPVGINATLLIIL
jgi:hypothetical protein